MGTEEETFVEVKPAFYAMLFHLGQSQVCPPKHLDLFYKVVNGLSVYFTDLAVIMKLLVLSLCNRFCLRDLGNGLPIKLFFGKSINRLA